MNDHIRIGIRVPPCAPASEVARTVADAEALGYDFAWFPDSQLLWRDVFVTMAFASAATSTIGLGAAVSNVVTRHRTVVASAINTVSELAAGRVVLGLGTGSSSIGRIGMSPAKGSTLRDAVDDIRQLLQGNSIRNGSYHLHGAAGHVPIYVAASGPKNLALAGGIADGVILVTGVAPEPLAEGIACVRRGAEDAGRDPDALDIVVGAFTHVTDDVERDCRIVKPKCYSIAQIGGQPFLRHAGIDLDDPGSVDEIYPDMHHAEDLDRAIERASLVVSDKMAVRFAETFCLFGSADAIIDRMTAAVAVGAKAFLLDDFHSYTLPTALLNQFGTDVLQRWQQ